MIIAKPQIDVHCPETDIYHNLLSLDNKNIVELGCGSADITRDIASSGSGRKVWAFEVDEAAHNKNLQLTDLPNVTFGLAGAQDIPQEDASVDVVFMFKSLHHVPLELMDQSLLEIRRVLKPGGLAYISEPVFDGEFNEVLRLFHDEQKVREAAFSALERAVNSKQFNLVDEVFFKAPMKFSSFSDFENKVIKVTHSDHKLSDDLLKQVKQAFDKHLGDDGVHFQQPIRVDLLQRPL
jgi:ubiquinone/menaquinone biosynthesis C-methylase UbiE